jgi:hypothetical protein
MGLKMDVVIVHLRRIMTDLHLFDEKIGNNTKVT